MKFPLSALVCLLFCCCMGTGNGLAQTSEPTTVLGYTWGTRYKECLLKLKDRGVKCKTVKNASIRYTLAETVTQLEFDEILGLATITVSRTFAPEAPARAMEYFNDQLRETNQTFGEYQLHQAHPKELLVFVWKLKKTGITLTYFIPSHTVTAEYSRIF